MSFFHSLFFICFANELTGFFAKEILVVIWLTMFLLNQISIKVLQSTLYYFILGYSSQVVWMAESFLVNFDLLSSPFLMVLKYNKFHWLNTYVKVSQPWLWKLFFSHRQLVVFVEHEIEKSMFQIHSFFQRLEKTRRNQKLYIKKTIYICILWYSKVCWFPMKNSDVSRTQGVCHVIYIFFDLL